MENVVANPSRPQNVTVKPDGNSLVVSWLPPIFPNGDIKYYILLWRKNVENQKFTMETVISSPFSLENLEKLTFYEIKIQAFNEVGAGNSSIPVIARIQQSSSSDKTLSSASVIGVAVGAILFLTLLLIILFFVRRKILKVQHAKSVMEFETRNLGRGLNNISNTSVKQECEVAKTTDPAEEICYVTVLEDWEIKSDHLTVLNKKLGEGQFGIVKQGLLKTGKGDLEVVAVKTLKANAKESDVQDLMAELKILKDVNKIPHPNVIKFIGGLSLAGKLHVVTEFCPGGALRDILIKSRIHRSSEDKQKYVNLASTLHEKDLLKIAAEISNGMAHLSSQKLVHRDLAARNILLAEDNTAKVADFGLARDVGGADEYIRNNQNLLPVKWMALESLLHGRFTTSSDVWSFGVLLYEITTLGEEPYKNISAYHVVSHVGAGCRMPKPESCSDDIYEIMSGCWKVEPAERPSFVDIRESLLAMLKDNEKPYINITHVTTEDL